METTSVLDNVENVSSVLNQAVQLQTLAARIGFDWPDIEPVFAKLTEEVAELRAEINAQAEQARLVDELGDILFVVVNLARHLHIDPEIALEHANKKFIQRFQKMEQQLHKDYPQQQHYELVVMDAVWNKIKHNQ
jgi:nucleoside triphosphate diphosphatase